MGCAWYVAPPGAQNCCGGCFTHSLRCGLLIHRSLRELIEAVNLERFYRIFEPFISTGVGAADAIPIARSASCG
jgi:hypothetical protein